MAKHGLQPGELLCLRTQIRTGIGTPAHTPLSDFHLRLEIKTCPCPATCSASGEPSLLVSLAQSALAAPGACVSKGLPFPEGSGWHVAELFTTDKATSRMLSRCPPGLPGDGRSNSLLEMLLPLKGAERVKRELCVPPHRWILCITHAHRQPPSIHHFRHHQRVLQKF